MTVQVEIGHTYILDGKTSVRVLKSLNRSKTMFSIELPNKSVDTVGVERLQPQHVDDALLDMANLDIEPARHSIPDISND